LLVDVTTWQQYRHNGRCTDAADESVSLSSTHTAPGNAVLCYTMLCHPYSHCTTLHLYAAVSYMLNVW